MLVFTNGLVSFQCHKSIRRQDVAIEALAYPTSNSIVHDLLKADWGFDYRVSSGVDFGTRTSNMFYDDCLTTFSQRQLTFESDRLPAFLGIANLIAAQIGTELFMGFPIAIFNLTILWRTYDENSTILSDSHREGKRLVPTWCWASWTGTKTTLNVGDDDDTKSTWAISTYEKEFFFHTWIVWYYEDHKDGVAFLQPLKELDTKSHGEVKGTQKPLHPSYRDSEVTLFGLLGSESHLSPRVPHDTPPARSTFRRYCGNSIHVASLADQYPKPLPNPAGYGALHFYTLCESFEFVLCQARCRRTGLGEQAMRLFAFRDKHGIPCGVFDMELGAGRHFPPHLLGKQDVIAISEDRLNRSRLDYWVGERTYLDNLRRKTEIEPSPSGRSWPLLTIMVVEWKDGIAYRKAPYIGRICQVAFEACLEPAEWKHVVLY